MAFIGESRKDFASPWKFYVCLDLYEVRLLMRSAIRLERECAKLMEKYKGILESGEATKRQENYLVFATENWESADSILTCFNSFVEHRKGGEK